MAIRSDEENQLVECYGNLTEWQCDRGPWKEWHSEDVLGEIEDALEKFVKQIPVSLTSTVSEMWRGEVATSTQTKTVVAGGTIDGYA